MKKLLCLLATVTIIAGSLTGCGSTAGTKKVQLNAEEPVSVVVWHYYNGAQKEAFDELVQEFNETEGKKEGIYVEGYSLGSVSDLEGAVLDAVNGVVGAKELPDIFSAYADTAYAMSEKDALVDFHTYLSDDELAEYVDTYIQEGYFKNDGALYLFPVAKSTETLMLNFTDWEPFARETGSTLEELQTTEGITEVAERYYEWTDALTPDISNDGKAFYGRDSMSNYFIIGMKQMGTDFFKVVDETVTIQAPKESMHRLWENYYVPYVKGYFKSSGKFRSDDLKTGDILAYTGSSSSASFFPDTVETEEAGREIEMCVLPAPVMEGGENVNVQQGAGMVVTKSDQQREYASCQFLKWFTEEENNIRFVCSSSYLPVKKEANTLETLDRVIREYELEVNDKAYRCLEEIISDYDNMTFYTPKCFKNSYDTRTILDCDLSERAMKDKEMIDQKIAEGANREEVLSEYISEEAFEHWYEKICSQLTDTATK